MNERIAIFVHQPKCSIQSGNGIIKALDGKYKFKIFTRHEVEAGFFDDVDLICVPGGIGDSDSFDYLMKENGNQIKNFVKRGGKYLGICMGAYWADSYYFNILDSIRVKQYIKQPNTCTRRPHAKLLTTIWNNKEEKLYFYDGCAMVGDHNKFQIIATYLNGDPMAVIQGNIGLIGCHPEAEDHWFNSYSWLNGKYIDQRKLLYDFVELLLKS